jgi:hypothetical protein
MGLALKNMILPVDSDIDFQSAPPVSSLAITRAVSTLAR